MSSIRFHDGMALRDAADLRGLLRQVAGARGRAGASAFRSGAGP